MADAHHRNLFLEQARLGRGKSVGRDLIHRQRIAIAAPPFRSRRTEWFRSRDGVPGKSARAPQDTLRSHVSPECCSAEVRRLVSIRGWPLSDSKTPDLRNFVESIPRARNSLAFTALIVVCRRSAVSLPQSSVKP